MQKLQEKDMTSIWLAPHNYFSPFPAHTLIMGKNFEIIEVDKKNIVLPKKNCMNVNDIKNIKFMMKKS
jgi:hypothetical protein